MSVAGLRNSAPAPNIQLPFYPPPSGTEYRYCKILRKKKHRPSLEEVTSGRAGAFLNRPMRDTDVMYIQTKAPIWRKCRHLQPTRTQRPPHRKVHNRFRRNDAAIRDTQSRIKQKESTKLLETTPSEEESNSSTSHNASFPKQTKKIKYRTCRP
jgi:hypothetical protein